MPISLSQKETPKPNHCIGMIVYIHFWQLLHTGESVYECCSL